MESCAYSKTRSRGSSAKRITDSEDNQKAYIPWYSYGIMKRIVVPLSLPRGLADQIDQLVKEGAFDNRSEALKHAARLLLLMMRRTHERAEDYAYSEIREGIIRGKKADVS